MIPAWNDTSFANDQLYEVYAGANRARKESPALRSLNRWFLDGDGGNDAIHAVAKYETANASPAASDVMLAFANLDRDNAQSDNYKIPPTLADLLGFADGRTYNVKNRAAFTGQVAGRDDLWLWGAGRSRSDLINTGASISMNEVPTTTAAWTTARRSSDRTTTPLPQYEAPPPQPPQSPDPP